MRIYTFTRSKLGEILNLESLTAVYGDQHVMQDSKMGRLTIKISTPIQELLEQADCAVFHKLATILNNSTHPLYSCDSSQMECSGRLLVPLTRTNWITNSASS